LASRLNQLQYQSLLKISRFCLHSPDNRTLSNATINKKYNYPAILKKDTVYISARETAYQSREKIYTARYEQKRTANRGNCVDEAR